MKDNSLSWRGGRGGFSLIELLLASAILVIIVLIVSEFFQKANVAWDVGSRKIETVMTGRAAVNLMARELSLAIEVPSGMSDSNLLARSEARFWMLGNPADGERAIRYVIYQLQGEKITRLARYFPAGLYPGSPPKEEATDMVEGVRLIDFVPLPGDYVGGRLPLSVIVSVALTNATVGGPVQTFQSAASFMCRDYNRLEGSVQP
jgi:prepilin-type N-terminal cleavage/methylation domain-containing protein